MDEYRIDSHKLNYHVKRVADWLKGRLIFPIYMEISPTGNCNHRCVHCGLDFMGYQNRSLDWAILRDRLSEMGNLGLKSIMFAGEGEPFLHRSIKEMIVHAKNSGIDVAVTTNGVLMRPDLTTEILGFTEWIKISCNAGTPETYSKIHRTKARDFEMVFANLKEAAAIRKERGHSCTLGIQSLLLPENENEMVCLAEKAKETGLDYLVIKPYSQHPQSHTRAYEKVTYGHYEELARKLERLNDERFSVIFRSHTMKRWDDKKKIYSRCLSFPFWSYLDAGGNIWGCSIFLNDSHFLYGNIYESTFKEIWQGERRLHSLQWAEKELDPAHMCRVNCRMDTINHYLWELKHPGRHVNFI